MLWLVTYPEFVSFPKRLSASLRLAPRVSDWTWSPVLHDEVLSPAIAWHHIDDWLVTGWITRLVLKFGNHCRVDSDAIVLSEDFSIAEPDAVPMRPEIVVHPVSVFAQVCVKPDSQLYVVTHFEPFLVLIFGNMNRLTPRWTRSSSDSSFLIILLTIALEIFVPSEISVAVEAGLS